MIFLPGTFQNVSVSRNETVQAVVSRIPAEVAFITLQFHTQHRNATLSYTRVRKCLPVSRFETRAFCFTLVVTANNGLGVVILIWMPYVYSVYTFK